VVKTKTLNHTLRQAQGGSQWFIFEMKKGKSVTLYNMLPNKLAEPKLVEDGKVLYFYISM
jgi:hypothetical protein